MFTESAELYDAIYSFKDYTAESAQVAALVRSSMPQARTLLDAGCGTGEHVLRLSRDHAFAADGLDIDPNLVDIARRKCPGARFFVADMSDFALGTRYDAIVSLFSSIGYLVTLERVQRAFVCFREHLAAGGVLVVEPWLAPGVIQAGRVFRHTGEVGSLRVERVSQAEINGRVSRLHFDYRLEGPDGVRHVSEVHDLGLFTVDEMAEAFKAAGFQATFDPVGVEGRGLWTAHTPR
jgi:SAM-dependent methyltransferase